MLPMISQAHRRFWQDTPWRGKAHRRLFCLCAICLSLYLSYVAYLSQSQLFSSVAGTLSACLWALLIAAGCYALLLLLCQKSTKYSLKEQARRERCCPRLFLASVFISLVILGCAFAACYPGAVSYDASNQWRQVQTGEFNSWHPLFHTLIIWLITRVSASYPFAVCVQLIAFAAAIGYLVATLRKRGVPAGVLLSVQAAVLLSPLVQNTLMYLGKDSAMTIGALVLTAQAINMLYTGGEWLKKPINAILFGLMLAFTTLVRHNAMLFTLPLLITVFLSYRKIFRQALLSAGMLALCMALVQGPLFGALNVVYPSNLLEESAGIPMTILGNVRQQNPEALDEETRAFLAMLATDEAWRTVYKPDSYNTIKFTFDRELIGRTPVDKLLRMTMNTIKTDPRASFEAFNGVTDLVWGVAGANEGRESVRNSGNIEEARYGSAKLNNLGKSLLLFIEAPMSLAPLQYVFENIGVQLLLLLLVTLWALYRHGAQVLTLAMPALFYNLATMLLLCGNDARFFQFFMVICLPSILALLYLPAAKEAQN